LLTLSYDEGHILEVLSNTINTLSYKIVVNESTNADIIIEAINNFSNQQEFLDLFRFSIKPSLSFKDLIMSNILPH
jgi:hypothetical protein